MLHINQSYEVKSINQVPATNYCLLSIFFKLKQDSPGGNKVKISLCPEF